MKFLLNTLYDQFRSSQSKTAFVIDDQEYSYAEFTRLIAAIQSDYITDRITPLYGIVASNHINTYAALFACWFSGLGFVLIHPSHPEKRNMEIITQTGIKTVLFPDKCKANIPMNAVDQVELKLSDSKGVPELSQVSQQFVASVLFTSGSTGIPKGVPMTFGNIASTMDSFFDLGYSLSSTDRFLQMFELSFDMSMLSYLPALMLGASVYTVGSDKIKYLEAANIMQKHKISFAAMVPSTLTLLKPYFDKISFPELRYSMLGGEAFYEDLAKAWSEVAPNAKLINISGPTEITMACMGYDIDLNFKANKVHNGILAFGYPWKNTIAVTVDENLKLLNNREVGELCFAGEHVMHGYLYQHQINAKTFFQQDYKGKSRFFYRTGDMAYLDEEGVFFTCGRKDKQVKIQGHKVELEEIDNLTRSLSGVSNSCSLVYDQSGIAEICLFVECEGKMDEEIQKTLKEYLPYYMIPSRLICLEEFPYSVNGKVDRVKLLQSIEGK